MANDLLSRMQAEKQRRSNLVERMQAEAARRNPERSIGDTIYENVIGRGEVDTPGERLGQLIRGLGAGAARGIADVPALPGNLAQMADNAGLALANKLRFAQGRETLPESQALLSKGVEALPNSQDTRGLLSYVTGGESDYKAPGNAGEYAATIGEFAGGSGAFAGPKAMLRYGALPGAASEAAGQATEGGDAEPWARLGAAILAPSAANLLETAGRRVVTPYVADPDTARNAAFLKSRGVNVTAGQRTGDPVLQYREAYGNPRIADNAMEQFTAAAMRSIGSEATRATDDALTAAYKSIGKQFDDFAARNQIKPDQTLVDDMASALDHYEESVGTQALMPKNIVAEVFDVARTGKPISGSQYNDWSSRLGKLTKSNDSASRDIAIALRGALDAALERSATSPAEMRAIQEARRLYRNYLIIERAASRGGPEAARGIITPGPLGSSTKQIVGIRNYTQGNSELGPLSRAGQATMTPPHGPESLVRNRAVTDALSGGLGLGSLALATGMSPAATAVAGALGVALPKAANKFASTAPGQAVMGNQLLGPGPALLGPRSVAPVPGIMQMLTE